MNITVPEILDEGRRLQAVFAREGIGAALLGGAGVSLHAHKRAPDQLIRSYADLDYVVRRAHAAAFRALLPTLGYEANQRFNALHGHKRLLFYDTARGRQIDVFIGEFRMCHALELDDQIPTAQPSLEPADLLLTKLQIVQINDKDLVDTMLLLSEHDVGVGPECIDRSRLAAVVGHDWGWHTTVGDNLSKVSARVSQTNLQDGVRDAIVGTISHVRSVLDEAPKSIGWRVRSRVGRRLPWYELPEEVAR